MIEISEHVGHGLFAGLILLLHIHRPRDQLVAPRQVQVVRNAWAIGEIRHRQFVTDGQAQYFTEAGGFIKLGQDATGQAAALVAVVGSGQHLLLAGGGQHQVILGLDAAPGQGFELHAQRRVAGLQARGIRRLARKVTNGSSA